MILMSHRIAQVARRHQVRGVVIGDVEVEMIDVKTAGHWPPPVHPLIAPVAAVRAVPDGVEQHQPVLGDQPARTAQDMFRNVHRTPAVVMDNNMTDPSRLTGFSLGEVSVPFDPGVVLAAKTLREVCPDAPAHSAEPGSGTGLFQAERVTRILPTSVVQSAEPAANGVTPASCYGAYRWCRYPLSRFGWSCGAFSPPAAVMHWAPPSSPRCSQAPVDRAVPSHTPSVAPCADWSRIGVDNSLQ